MKYRLKAYNIWEQGPREKQEDSIFPEYGKSTEADRLFILCDGMGGHSAGEVASSTVCKAMSESVFAHCKDSEGTFTDEDFLTALKDAFDELDTKDNGAEKKMGTTLTFLKFHDKGCTIAHIGDSRVYHIRPGKSADDTEILFQTSDHSLVNDLIKIGELTPEEAKISRQKNVITRAMQPCMERRTKADLYHTHDIRPGDYFMLCSDGILEQMEDNNLKYIFSEKGGSIENKVDMLIKVTYENRDNHSAHLIQITDVIDPIPVEETIQIPEMLIAKVEDDNNKEEVVATTNMSPSKAKMQRNNRNILWLALVVIFLGLLGLGYGCYKWLEDKPEKPETEKPVIKQRPVEKPSPMKPAPVKIPVSAPAIPETTTQPETVQVNQTQEQVPSSPTANHDTATGPTRASKPVPTIIPTVVNVEAVSDGDKAKAALEKSKESTKDTITKN